MAVTPACSPEVMFAGAESWMAVGALVTWMASLAEAGSALASPGNEAVSVCSPGVSVTGTVAVATPSLPVNETVEYEPRPKVTGWPPRDPAVAVRVAETSREEPKAAVPTWPSVKLAGAGLGTDGEGLATLK